MPTLKIFHGKFATWAHNYIFVGYPTNLKGYKVYVIETKTIFDSCDVFYENNFHTKAIQIEDPSCDLPLPQEDCWKKSCHHVKLIIMSHPPQYHIDLVSPPKTSN